MKKIVFGVVSGFMKDNLEAKFHNEVFESSKLENPNLKTIEFKVDLNIDNLQILMIIDCANFFKWDAKAKKAKK